MSIKVMQWVWEESPTKEAERLVLLAIADNANDEGFAWPSLATIAKKAAIDRSSVPDVLRRLVEKGLLTIQRRTHENGSAASNLYRVVWTEEISRHEKAFGRLGVVAGGNHQGGSQGQPGWSARTTRVVGEDNQGGGPGQPESLINHQSTSNEIMDETTQIWESFLSAIKGALITERQAEDIMRYTRSVDLSDGTLNVTLETCPRDLFRLVANLTLYKSYIEMIGRQHNIANMKMVIREERSEGIQ